MKIEAGDWASLKQHAQKIRELVFIQEQDIPENEEWDDLDSVSLHFIVWDDTTVIATARLLPNNSIGRVAVLKSHRGLGIGFKLMQEIILVARQEQRKFLELSAQVHAISFYEKLGFQCEGHEYLDCGIPHITMKMEM
jgi:predicted GNAT family N-acyltransferase